MGHLTEIVADFATGMVARGALASTSRVKLGPEYLHENDDYPRVVFVPGKPGSDTIGPSDRAGGNSRQRAVIGSTCSVHCWAANYGAAETLRDLAIAQLIDTCGGMSKDSLTFGTGGFTQETVHDQRGKEYVFSLRIVAPVLDVTYANAPDGVHTKRTGKMIFPGSETTGCSEDA